VTGAGSGIGRATALLAHDGAAVVVADIERAGGRGTVETIRRDGGRAVRTRRRARSAYGR
jgi:NAD(P)-dependent dehydrogenase (short-subunit alcohol dehydrogenase family)